MNYRHAYHAGNACDVMKHALLCLLLQHLGKKETPFSVIDTHAGAGGYDLAAPESSKTGEAASGVALIEAAVQAGVLAANTGLSSYLSALADWRVRTHSPSFYPGSPLLALTQMRTQDRLVLCEKHPEEFAKLCSVTRPRTDPRIQLHERDGYEALLALVPPKERRGLVLIDPPYEDRDEFERAAKILLKALQRWPTGIYALWYPIKDRAPFWRCLDMLMAAHVERFLQIEMILSPETRSDHLNGSGLLIVNPPWQFDVAASEVLEKIAPILAVKPYAGQVIVRMLSEETSRIQRQ